MVNGGLQGALEGESPLSRVFGASKPPTMAHFFLPGFEAGRIATASGRSMKRLDGVSPFSACCPARVVRFYGQYPSLLVSFFAEQLTEFVLNTFSPLQVQSPPEKVS